MPSANAPQCQFLALPQRFRAYVGGYGSGKTWAGCMDQCTHAWEHPRINQGYFAPTYPIIRDVFYPTIEECASTFGLRVEIKEGNKEVHFFSGSRYRSTTICRSMEDPNRIVGFKIGNALVDELDVLPPNKATTAWRKIIARMRNGEPGILNRVNVTTTPEGFRATHRMFVADVSEHPERADRYGLVQASTYDNELNLPEDYIPSLREAYTEELIDAYIEGRFVNLTSGTVYRRYNRLLNGSSETIRPPEKIGGKMVGEPLRWGMDFNVTKMAATCYVTRPNGWHAVAELKDVFDTPAMVKILKDRWQSKGHQIIVYPDPTGKNRETVDASSSDIALLEQAGFTVKAHNSSPSVKGRILAANLQFERAHVWVNARACPTVAKCLEGQVYDDNGEPDKKGGFDHQNDATTYPLEYEFPIIHNRVRRVTVGGI